MLAGDAHSYVHGKQVGSSFNVSSVGGERIATFWGGNQRVIGIMENLCFYSLSISLSNG